MKTKYLEYKDLQIEVQYESELPKVHINAVWCAVSGEDITDTFDNEQTQELSDLILQTRMECIIDNN